MKQDYVVENYDRAEFNTEVIIKVIEDINKHKAVGIDELDYHLCTNLSIAEYEKIVELFIAYNLFRLFS